MSEDRELTVKEAAALLRIHPETVREWCRDGRLPHARLLSRQAGWRIPKADVDAVGRETGRPGA